MYQLFDTTFACDLPLPWIPTADSQKPNIHILCSAEKLDESDLSPRHEWHDPSGELVVACFRDHDAQGSTRYLLRFPDLADFTIEKDSITCYPLPDCGEDTLCHLLLDQVVPRFWAQRGNLVLHASAVQLPDSRVIAFLGESGWGKSTLVAALQQVGGRLLSDDCLSVHATKRGVELVPSYPGLRLNKDSIDSLELAGQGWTNVAQYSRKRRSSLPIDCGSGSFFLDRLYLMEPPGLIDSGIQLTKPGGAERLTTLLKNSFLLDAHDNAIAAWQLQAASAVLDGVPNVYSLAYPRDFEQLPIICRTLMS